MCAHTCPLPTPHTPAGAGLVGSLPARKIARMTLFFGFPPIFFTAGLALRYPAMDPQSTLRALALKIMLVTGGSVHVCRQHARKFAWRRPPE